VKIKNHVDPVIPSENILALCLNKLVTFKSVCIGNLITTRWDTVKQFQPKNQGFLVLNWPI